MRLRTFSPVRLLVVLGLLVSAAVALPANATELPTPTVKHIPHASGIKGQPFNHYPYGIGLKGYSDEEYQISGTTSGGSAYTTRMIVRRPTDPRTFNGTLVAEWHNVTGDRDLDIDFMWAHDFLLSRGDVYLGISAQAVGVAHRKAWDPGPLRGTGAPR
jgi:hypothetical protein